MILKNNFAQYLKKAKRLLLVFFTLFVLVQACRPIRSLGKNPSGEAQRELEVLPNYQNEAFHNLYTFPPDSSSLSRRRKPGWMRLLGYFFHKKPADTKPGEPLPSILTDLKKNNYKSPTVIWFGHSSFLLKAGGANLLFDPSFSGFAGPFKGLINAFPDTTPYSVDDLPPVDALVISHDHYDHLDYLTVKKLKKKVKQVIVPKGVGSHFRRWGYPPEKIREVYWNETVRINDSLTITATPAHHRSNRTMAQNKTLWASYVIKAAGSSVYFSGDTGYSQHFKDIGEAYGPFDLAMMECGQYNSKWAHNHMFPEQTARAAIDLKAKQIIPVHWGKFAESEHRWNEPVERLLASADSLKLQVIVPMIGQPFTPGQAFQQTKWWK